MKNLITLIHFLPSSPHSPSLSLNLIPPHSLSLTLSNALTLRASVKRSHSPPLSPNPNPNPNRFWYRELLIILKLVSEIPSGFTRLFMLKIQLLVRKALKLRFL
ncbi:hypothetical protein Droror1_Dr00009549 [Drosera rotundifolia]